MFSALLTGLLVAGALPTQAQQAPIAGCKTDQITGGGVVYRCANGLTIETKQNAAPRRMFPDLQTVPEVFGIRERAILIIFPKGTGRLQIRTPHAIASVRGTEFVVDPNDDSTSIFVSEGRVEVEQRTTGQSVILAEGDGIDLGDEGPLEVKQWPEQRVRALLSRFGR